jgi:S-adenosylmethionine:tRNA ribosyltransferase-isomerase
MKEDPKHIRISEFNYPLPDERIAKFPLPVRDQSKLLLYRHGEVTEDIFTSLPDYLPANSLMIFNNTKVIQARLHFHKVMVAYHGEPTKQNVEYWIKKENWK